jgi:hypothetical protein
MMNQTLQLASLQAVKPQHGCPNHAVNFKIFSHIILLFSTEQCFPPIRAPVHNGRPADYGFQAVYFLKLIWVMDYNPFFIDYLALVK